MSNLDLEFNIKAPCGDTAKMDEYVRRLRLARLNHSDRQAQMSVHNYENRIASDFVKAVLERIYPRDRR